MLVRYTIERVRWNDIKDDQVFLSWGREVGKHLTALWGNRFDWRNFPIAQYADENRMIVCRRDGIPVGVMLSRLGESPFDPTVKILRQDLLFAEPGTRAAKLLLDEFIDFGRSHANHVVTMIAKNTRIKRRSLKRLGFVESELTFRLET